MGKLLLEDKSDYLNYNLYENLVKWSKKKSLSLKKAKLGWTNICEVKYTIPKFSFRYFLYLKYSQIYLGVSLHPNRHHPHVYWSVKEWCLFYCHSKANFVISICFSIKYSSYTPNSFCSGFTSQYTR